MDTRASENKRLILGCQEEAQTNRMFEAFLEAAPQFIIQLYIILQTGEFNGWTAAVSLVTSFGTLSLTGCSLYYSQRLGSYSDKSPDLRFKAVVFPFIALNCAATLVSWTVIVSSFKIYSLLIPFAHLLVQTLISAFYHWSNKMLNYEEIFYNELISYSDITGDDTNHIKSSILEICQNLHQERVKTALLSILTSWLTPFTVMKNSQLDRVFDRTFFGTRYFAVSSLSMHIVTLAFTAHALFYNLFSLNSKAQVWFNAYEDGSNCDEKEELCLLTNLQLKAYTFVVLLLTFLCTAILLQFLGDYHSLYKPFNCLPGWPFLVHCTVFRDLLIFSSEDETGLASLVMKSRKSVFSKQDTISGDTCLLVAIKHGRIDIAKLMIERDCGPLLKNFAQENLETLLNAQTKESCSTLQWNIAINKVNSKLSLEYSKGRIEILEGDQYETENKSYLLMKGLFFETLASSHQNGKPPNISGIQKILKRMNTMSKSLRDSCQNCPKSKNSERHCFQNIFEKAINDGRSSKLLICMLAGFHGDVNETDSKNYLSSLTNTYKNQAVMKLLWKKHCESTKKLKYSHYLATIGNLDMLKAELKQNHSEIIQDETLVLCASANGNDKVLAFLIDSGANKDAQGQYGMTALHLAARKGHELCLKVLIENGANVGAKDEDGWTALHYAAQNGHNDCVKLLVEAGANIDAMIQNGMTAVHFAAKNGDEHCLNILIEHGANIDAQSQSGSTALHYAADNGHEHCLKLLIEKGANKDTQTATGSTALHLASQNGHDECLKLLIEMGANRNIQKLSGATALHLAAQYGRDNCLMLLIDKGIKKDAQNLVGVTALHLAARYGYESSLKLLIERGADMNVQTQNRLTALHLAAYNGYKNCIKLLIEKGALNDVQDENGLTALHVASIYGRESCLRVLIENGANKDAQDKNGVTALHFAAQKGHGNCLKLLIQMGANKDALARESVTALHLAAQNGTDNCVQLLVENGANKEMLTQDGLTALDTAIRNGFVNCVNILQNF